MVNFQGQSLKRTGATPSKSQSIIKLQGQKKEQLSIGMGSFTKPLLGWMACRQCISAPLLLGNPSPTSSRLICTDLPGITLTILVNMLVCQNSCNSVHNKTNVISGGLFGPMIIHGPSNADYDIDLGPVMLTDWYHDEYFEIVKTVMKPLDAGGNPAPPSDNNLINGKMDFDCSTLEAGDKTKCTNSAGISKFKFTTGKTHRLRLVCVLKIPISSRTVANRSLDQCWR